MAEETRSPYTRSHLVMAAIRILEHQTGAPPKVEDMASMLSFSLEEVHSLLHLLEKINAVKLVESPAGPRPQILDPAPVEDLPRESQKSMEKDLAAFAARQKERMDSLAKAASSEADRKKALFAELEKQLKGGGKD
ncbi:MAG: hypothetical protein JRI97_05530 [Deltaproteobacteria bacterium]|nr:hypothetical protein [Deltaproteobacteria bacterium]